MALTNKNGIGAADAGCPITPQGDCVLNGMPVSCSLIRECDSVTGNLHYEYAMPYSTGNVNINVADNQGKLIGYNNSQGRFIDTADVPISNLVNRGANASNAASIIEQAKAQAIREAQAAGLPAFQVAIAASLAAARAMANIPNTNVLNTQAGSVTGAIINTPQTTTSQQGTPANAHVTNTNASTNNGQGNNSVTPSGATTNTTGMNFSSLLTAGSNWFDGTTYGVKNTYWAIGAALAIAVGGGYVGGKTRRGF